MRLLLLMLGALLLTNCASHHSEAEQDASALKSAGEQVVADGSSDKLALTEVRPVPRDDEIICKKQREIGSKIPKPELCATRKQWSDRTKLPREQWKNELNKGYSS